MGSFMLNIQDLCQHHQVHETVHPLINGLQGSMILKIAAQVRELQAQGKEVCNLTVGDFDPKHFPIPTLLSSLVQEAYQNGQTNYPPSDGVLALKEAIHELYERQFGLSYGTGGVCVASGARPPLYACYNMFVGPGEYSASFLPSWNNSYYAHLQQSQHIFVPTTAESNFHPTIAQIKEILPKVQLIALNSPLNPTGTVMDRDVLEGIAKAIVEENAKRRNRRPVMLMFDQVYWMLLAEGKEHFSPVQLVPEIAPYVIHIDAISKAFAATGLRVGWAVLPSYLQPKMKDLIGHVGAWAAKPEQVATAAFLRQPEAVDAYMMDIKSKIAERLDLLYSGIMALKEKGYPVDAIAPQGAIYLSFYVGLIGNRFKSNEDIRNFLLEEAGVAVVPFQAFDMEDENGWFRMSVGSCGVDELKGALERLETVLSVGAAQ